MASHPIVPSWYKNGVWTVIPSSEIHEASGIEVTRGYASEGQFRPSKIAWTFNDPTGKWDPDNPESELYATGGRNTWVALAADAVVVGTGEVSLWDPDNTPEFNATTGKGRRWVSIEAEGVLRRLNQWDEVLASPMRRKYENLSTLRGLWMLEDGNDATQPANQWRGGLPGYSINVDYQGGDGPLGADKVVKLSATSLISGTFPAMSTTAGWQMFWSAKVAAAPTGTPQTLIRWRTANGYDWQWNVDSGGVHMKVIDLATATTLKDAYYSSPLPVLEWQQHRMKVTQVGGNVQIEGAWYNQGGELYGFTETFAGTVSAPVWWRAVGNAYTTDGLLAGVGAVTGTTDDLDGFDFRRAFDGYVGERALDRFLRLCLEAGISRTTNGAVANLSAYMGRQRPISFMDLMKEIADTDDAMIFDRHNIVGLVMRSRSSRLNQAPALVLNWPGEVAPPLKKSIDDQGIHNQITVSNINGSEVTVVQETGRMSVQDQPAGVGEYRFKYDVNLANENDLLPLAYWYLARGTVRGARYRSVTVDLDANPSLAAAVGTTKPGDRIKILGKPPETIDLIVIGISDKISDKRRTVEFTCTPGEVFDVAVYDYAFSMYDSRSTTLAEDMTLTETLWDLTTWDQREIWPTTGYPIEALVEGEHVTITAMTAATGTGPFLQTATVTRSVNQFGVAGAGVVKTHVTGEEFHLHPDYQTRYAL